MILQQKKLAGALRRMAVGAAALLLAGIVTIPALTGYGSLHVLAAEDKDALYSTEGGKWIPVDENTWVIVKEDGNPDNEKDIIATVVKNGDQWEYSFKVADDAAEYYGWEQEVPKGYKVEGQGTRKDPAKSEYVSMGVKKYSHTPNISDEGVQNGDYANNLKTNDVVTVPGAKKLHIELTYGGESSRYDWVSMWEGSHPDYTAVANSDSGIEINRTKKFGGSKETVECDIDGDTVTFAFHSDSSGRGCGYGYYAVVTGLVVGDFAIVNTKESYTPEQEVKTGGLMLTKQLADADPSDTASDSQNFFFDITLSTENETLSQKLAGSHVFGDVPFIDGKGMVDLKDGQSISLSGIPAGVSWTIKEAAAAGYTPSMTVNGTASGTAGEVSGIIKDEQMVDVICTNTKTTTPPPTPEETGSFKVKKKVENGVEGDKFTFSTALQNLKANTDYTVVVAGTEQTVRSNAAGIAYLPFTLQNGQIAEFKELPIGATYQVQEDASDYTASYEIAAENHSVLHTVMSRRSNAAVNQSLSTQKETLEKGEQALITFTNRKAAPKPDVVNLTVKKVWNDQNNAGGIRPDSISVALCQSDTEGETGDIVATAQLDKAGQWTHTFTDLDRYQDDGRTPYYYTVAEDPVAGYDSKVEKSADGNTITITNTADELPLGDLKISKTVEGDGAPTDESFRFTVHLTREVAAGEDQDDDSGSVTTMTVPVKGTFSLDSSEGKGTKTGTVYFDENGDAQIKLKAGESAYITGLPAGASYTVTEESFANWKASLEDGSADWTGNIDESQPSDIKVKNTWAETVSLTVSKTVQGNMGDKTKAFDFTLTLTAPAGMTLPTELIGEKDGESVSLPVTDGQCTFTLAHGETIKISGIPRGSQYSIAETEVDDYKASYIIGKGKATDAINGETLLIDTEVSVVNKRNLSVPTLASMNTIAPLGLMFAAGAVLLLLIWKYRIASYMSLKHKKKK